MKNFRRFNRAYEALLEARRSIIGFSAQKVIEYYESHYMKARNACVAGIDKALDAMLEWFDEHFPASTMDAAHSDQFTYPEFFAMLKAHPELVETNEDGLKSLLASLKAKGLYGTGLNEFPSIEEFIPERLAKKKEYVPLAIAELEKIKDDDAKEVVDSVVAKLKLRRPLAGQASLDLLILRSNIKSDETRALIAKAREYLEKIEK